MAITDYTQEEAIQKFKEAGYSDDQINAYMKKHASEFKSTPTPTPEPQGTYDSSSSFDELTGNVNTTGQDDYALLTNEESKSIYGDTGKYANEGGPKGNKTLGTLNLLAGGKDAIKNTKIKVKPTNTEALTDREISITVEKAAKQLMKEFPGKSKAWYQKMLPKVIQGGKDLTKWLSKHAGSIIAGLITAYDTNADLRNGTLRTSMAEGDKSLLGTLKDAGRGAYYAIDNEILMGALPNRDAVYNNDPEAAEAQAKWFEDQDNIKQTYKTLKKYDKEVSKLGEDGPQAVREIVNYIIGTRDVQQANNNDTYASIAKNFDYKKFKGPDGQWKQDRVYVGKNKKLQGHTLSELRDSGIKVSDF